MDEKVAFLVRGLQTRFPDAGITETLAAVNAVLTQPTLSLRHAQARQRQGGKSSSATDSGGGGRGGPNGCVVNDEWWANVTAVMHLASSYCAPSDQGCPRSSLPQRLEWALQEWSRLRERHVPAGTGAPSDSNQHELERDGGGCGNSNSGTNTRQGSEPAAMGGGFSAASFLLSPRECAPDEAGADGVRRGHAEHQNGRVGRRSVGAVPPSSSPRGRSLPGAASAASRWTNNGSFDATPSMVSIDATPEELPVYSPALPAQRGAAWPGAASPASSGRDLSREAVAGSNGSASTHASAPPREAVVAAVTRGGPVIRAGGGPNGSIVALAPTPISASQGGNEEDEQEQARVLATAESSARLAEELCRGVYEDLYDQLVVATRSKDDPEQEASQERAANEVEDDDLPAPLCSLVIECDGSGSGIRPAMTSGNGGQAGPTQDPADSVFSFVVGCSWTQWDYLRRGPLACECPPYPPHAVPREEKMRWRQRHCQVRLLHPVSDFLPQSALGSPLATVPPARDEGGGGNGGRRQGSSSNRFDPAADASSDITTTNVEYDLSEGHVVLRSLLGLAMRVWGDEDAHLVAQIADLEATVPIRTFRSDVFWSNFPQNVPPPLRRGDRASLRGCHLPTPLLPGEYVDIGDDEDCDEQLDATK